MLVLLGEVGGVEEYEVCDAINAKRITKPVVAWCIGTCAGASKFRLKLLKLRVYTVSGNTDYMAYSLLVRKCICNNLIAVN